MTLTGGLSLSFNTTTTPQAFTSGARSRARRPAGGSFVRVEVKNGTLMVAGASLTVDRFVAGEERRERLGDRREPGFLLQAGSTRVLQIQNASFAFLFTPAGVAVAAT